MRTTKEREPTGARAGRLAAWAAALVGVAAVAGCAADREGEARPLAAPRTVAEVNGQPLYDHQVDEILAAEAFGAPGAPAGADDPTARRRKALDLLIAGELVVQDARARAIDVPEGRVDERLEVARSQFASDEEFQAHLREAGTSLAGLRDVIERGLLMEAWAESMVPGLEVDEAGLRRVYEAQREHFRLPDEVHVAHILVRSKPTDPPERREERRRAIEAALARIRGGEEFAGVAAEVSESPTAEHGGDLGFLPRERMLPEFARVAFETPPGRTSEVFETPLGLNLVRVLERREGRLRSFEEVRDALVLVAARDRKDEEARRRVEQLRAGAQIRILDQALAGER